MNSLFDEAMQNSDYIEDRQTIIGVYVRTWKANNKNLETKYLQEKQALLKTLEGMCVNDYLQWKKEQVKV